MHSFVLLPVVEVTAAKWAFDGCFLPLFLLVKEEFGLK